MSCFCLWGRPPGVVEEADCGLMSRVIGPCGKYIIHVPCFMSGGSIGRRGGVDYATRGAFPFSAFRVAPNRLPARTHPHRTIRDGAVDDGEPYQPQRHTRWGENHETNSKKFFAERKLPRTCPRRCPPRAVCVEGPVPLCGLLSVYRLHALHRPSTVALDHEDGVLKVLRACRANHV